MYFIRKMEIAISNQEVLFYSVAVMSRNQIYLWWLPYVCAIWYTSLTTALVCVCVCAARICMSMNVVLILLNTCCQDSWPTVSVFDMNVAHDIKVRCNKMWTLMRCFPITRSRGIWIVAFFWQSVVTHL